MYAVIAWVLVSSGTQAQPQIILGSDFIPDYLSVFYNYDKYEQTISDQATREQQISKTKQLFS